MKKYILGILAIALLVCLAVAASAVTVQETFNENSPTFGGRNQEASNPEHDDEDNFNIYDDGSLTLVNNDATQAYTITGITFTSSAGFSTADLNLSRTSTTNTVPASGTLIVSLQARIPEKLDAVNTNLKEQAFQVATATINLVNGSGVASTVTVPLYMQRENILEINDAKVETNGKDRKSLDDGDDLDNLKPSDALVFDLEVENLADKDSNLELSNAKVQLTCDDEDNFDVNDDNSEEDITEDDKQTFNFEVTLDDDAKDGSTGCIFEVESRDANGARHADLLDFNIKIERENHDITIKDVTMIPQELTCDDKSFQLNVDVMNLGKTDEKETAIEVEGRTLKFLKKISNLRVDEDDSSTEVFDVPVPSGLSSGIHVLQVRTFYDNDKASDSKIVQINNACGTATPVEEQTQPAAETLTLTKTAFTGKAGESVSIPVKVTNTMSGLQTFTVTIVNGEDFIGTVSPKTLSLNAGQSSTVFLNTKLKTDVQPGDYSASINVESNGRVVDSETVTMKIEAGTSTTPTRTGFLGSTNFWIVIDILLIVAAVVILWFIFRRKE
ncbi:MAG: hypothetical protein Q7R96_06715 [Nanoarchaeota archaeon]|nr:hypothetical protein [Nanoarchaeota archaeon]